MSLTLGLTGMDPATETALQAAFVDANARLGGHWSLVPDADAGHVVVDMDSMYGPMSWLRLHAAGRKVIGLTSAPRTQTDYRLGRPFDTDQMVALLTAIAQAEGIRLPAAEVKRDAVVGGNEGPDAPPAQAAAREPAAPAATTATPLPTSTATATAAPVADSASTHAPADAPEPVDPATAPVAVAEDTAPGGVAGVAAATGADGDAPDAGGTPDHADEARQVPPAERTLAAWLQPGMLQGRRRFASARGPTLLIDADAELWHGPATLKPLVPLFDGVVDAGALEPVPAEDWDREAAAAGAAQPLTRLRWLGGLLAGGGVLVPGVDPDGRFQLTRWPQTEREFPRHFRIATQMMKGPATVAEIAEASGMPAADVADFVNANLATGFAEPVVEAPQPVEPAKPRGGLLGRLRR